MTDPIKTHKRRVPLTARQIKKLSNRKRALDEATREILYDRPESAAHVIPPDPTLKTCSQIVSEYLAANGHLKPKTISEWTGNLAKLSDFIGPRPFSRQMIEEFITDLHKSDFADTTKWLIGTIVSQFVKWLFETKRIAEDYRTGVRFPLRPAQKPREPFTEKEYNDLLEASEGKPIRFLMILAFHTGMAITDCCQLTWGNVDIDRCRIVRARTKTGVETVNEFQFGGALHRAMLAQRDDTVRAFNSVQPGLPVCRQAYGNKATMEQAFRRLCSKLGIVGKSFHHFRGGMLTDVANSNMPMNVALKVAGVRSVGQLMGYVTTKPGSVREHVSKIRK